MHVDGAAVVALKREVIANRLRHLQYAECEWLARYADVSSIRCELHEDARIRAAFVKLPRGMQKARAVPYRRRHLQCIAQVPAQSLQQLVVLGSLLNVAEQRDVISATGA